MISWIQRTFQQHFRAVFGVLLAVTIVSFIATIGAAPGIGNGERHTTEEDFYGHNLANAAETNAILRDGQDSLRIRDPQEFYYLDADRMRDYAFQRVVALALADQWHLPAVSPDSPEMVAFIEHQPAFAGADGKFDPAAYARFRDQVRSAGEDAEQQFARILSEDYRIQRVERLIGGPGYILPSDVREDLEREDTLWTVDTVSIDYTAFKGPETINGPELTKYFSANAQRYTIPARVSVGYIDFPAAQYMAQVQVTDAEARAYYDRNPARFPKPAADKAPVPLKPQVAPKSNPDADFAAVRPQVVAALKMDQARNLATKDASDFSYALYQAKVTPGPTLQDFLAAHHVTEKTLPPFSADAAPAELGGSADAASTAFGLTADHFFSEATPTPNGAVVMIWKGNEAPRQPLLAEVRARVEADYLADQKRQAFTAAGARLKADIAARMKQGLAFDKAVSAAAAAEGLKVTVKALPPFKLSDRPQDVNPVLLQTISNLSPGQISDVTIEGNEGLMVYDQSRQLPDLAKSAGRFAEVRGREAMYFSQVTANEFLGELVAARLKGTPIERE